MAHVNYAGIAGTVNGIALTGWQLSVALTAFTAVLTLAERHPFATGDEVNLDMRQTAGGVGFLGVGAMVLPAKEGDGESVLRVQLMCDELPPMTM